MLQPGRQGWRASVPRPAALPGRSFGLALALCCAAPAIAAPRIAVPAALQQAAAPCLAEALRLCPAALSARDHGLSCILGKRRLLSRSCQAVYDAGLQLLKGGDLHLTLRRPAAR